MSFHEIQYWDRNAKSFHDHEDTTAGPHVGKERMTYAVPRDRQALLELLHIKLRRMTAAAVVGTVHGYVQLERFLPPVSDTSQILSVRMFTNNVDDKDKTQIESPMLLNYGDILHVYTSDSSTGGTVRIFLSFKVTEFDAYLYETPPITRPIPEKPDIQEIEEKPWWWPF